MTKPRRPATTGARSEAAVLALHLADLLTPFGPVRTKRFFGGVALTLDGVQFAFVMKGTLYLRVGDDSRNDFIGRGAEPFRYSGAGGRTVEVARYYSAPPELLDDVDELCRWVGRAHAAAGTKPRRAARRKKT